MEPARRGGYRPRMPATRIDEIAPGIHRVSTFLPEGPPGGITHNQFVVTAREPLLFHAGLRRLFPTVRAAVSSVLDPAELRWISSTHASRPDEYGAVEEWLGSAPRAQVAHGRLGCLLCLAEITSRPPRPLADEEVLDLGGARVRWLDTPHVPGPWEAGVLFEEVTATLFCGDLFSRTGEAAVTTSEDIVAAAVTHEQTMHGYAITPALAPTLRRLAALRPRQLALMHGPTFIGDGAAALRALATHFDDVLARTRDAT